ncbi:MAG: hypothetical protein MRY83_07150 [Flavobacteriales bacterium]|nr:hypothetical protein [Flavobacteriales bacterium]
MINRENYEIFFIDYFEGNLDFETQNLLFKFLDENPDLQQEFQEFEPVTLEQETVSLDKSFLKKELKINSSNEDDYIIGLLEDDLSKEERHQIKIYLDENPSKQKKLRQFEHSKVAPDKGVIYHDKSSLKRSVVIPFLRVKTVFRMAAAVLLLFLLTSIIMLMIGERPAVYQARNEGGNWNIITPPVPLNSFQIAEQTQPRSIVEDNFENTALKTQESDFEDKVINYKNIDLMTQKKHQLVSSSQLALQIKPKIETKPQQRTPEIEVKDDFKNPSNFLTAAEFLRSQVRKRILKKEPTTEQFDQAELIASIEPVIDRLKPSFIETSREFNQNSKTTKLKIGSFEVTRVKKN